ncbi:DNA topoisomerase 2-binding protein 1 [Halotydeus destructor]|nr:DNA topoisomerase 2-binding protein 1 [Halotydeus destructor]
MFYFVMRNLSEKSCNARNALKIVDEDKWEYSEIEFEQLKQVAEETLNLAYFILDLSSHEEYIEEEITSIASSNDRHRFLTPLAFIEVSKRTKKAGGWCVHNGTQLIPFPFESRNVLIGLCMSKVCICSTGLSQHGLEELKSKIEAMGGFLETIFGPSVTHLITDDIEDETSKVARSQMIPILKPSWVNDCFEKSFSERFKAADLMKDHVFPVFDCSIVVSIDEFTADEKAKLIAIVRLYGATFCHGLKHRTTHLVSSCESSDKHNAARKNSSIKIVKPSWIYDSVKEGKALPEKNYLVASRRVRSCRSISDNNTNGHRLSLEGQHCATKTPNIESVREYIRQAKGPTCKYPLRQQRIHITGVSKEQLKVLERAVELSLGFIVKCYNQNTQVHYVVIGDNLEATKLKYMKMATIMGTRKTNFVSLQWLTDCLATGRLNDARKYVHPSFSAVHSEGKRKRKKDKPSAPEAFLSSVQETTMNEVVTVDNGGGIMDDDYLSQPEAERDANDVGLSQRLCLLRSLRLNSQLLQLEQQHSTKSLALPLEEQAQCNTPLDLGMDNSSQLASYNAGGIFNFGHSPLDIPNSEVSTQRPSISSYSNVQEIIGSVIEEPRQDEPELETIRDLSPSSNLPASELLNEKSPIRQSSARESALTDETILMTEPRTFMISGLCGDERTKCIDQITSLGGICSKSVHADAKCSHLIIANIERNEKFLSALAMGIWILKPSYLEASSRVGYFVSEFGHQWKTDQSKMSSDTFQTRCLDGAVHRKSFQDCTVFIVTGMQEPKGGGEGMEASCRRIVNCGGAKSVQSCSVLELDSIINSWPALCLGQTYLVFVLPHASMSRVINNLNDTRLKSRCLHYSSLADIMLHGFDSYAMGN